MFGLHTNSGIFSSSSLCPARLRGSSLVTINPPLALLSTYRIPEASFTTSLHSEPVVCFFFFLPPAWEPKHATIRLLKSDRLARSFRALSFQRAVAHLTCFAGGMRAARIPPARPYLAKVSRRARGSRRVKSKPGKIDRS